MSDFGTYIFSLPVDADDDIRADFASVYTQLYRDKDWENETLSEYFVEDFKSFSKENFAALPTFINAICEIFSENKVCTFRKGEK